VAGGEAAERADVAALLGRIAELEARLARAEAAAEEYRKLAELLREENARLRRGLLGQKAERLGADDRQLSLALLGMLLGQDGEGEGAGEQGKARRLARQRIPAHERRKPRRKAPPEDLPRVEIELTPLEVEREGVEHFERIGCEETTYLERRPQSFVAVVVRRPKYVRRERPRDGPARVVVAEVPELPIERGVAGPGLLADTLVRRWQDHLPLHRLEGIYAREGVELARSTVCGWHERLAELARPLVEAMLADALAQDVLCTDATGVLVQARERCRTGHFWVLVSPGRHVLFRYSRRHDGKAVDAILGGYRGHLVADAASVFDHLYADGAVVEVGCWSHARRYFHRALASDRERALEGLGLIGRLFEIERGISAAPRKRRLAVRREQSRPVVEAFFAWCDRLAAEVVAETPIARAVTYARNQRRALERFLQDPRLPLHNNASELALRRQVVGRKAWLFVGTDEAAGVNATFTSLLASCAMHGIEPWAYLRDLLCLLPGWPQRRVLELAPVCWKETSQQAETQERLAAHPLRRAVLSLDGHPPRE